MSKTKGAVHKRSLLAHNDLERLGINPLENLLETRRMALEAYKTHRGYNDKGDAGVGYLGLVMRADLELVALKYAKMSALAIKDMTEGSSKAPLTTSQAIDIIKQDPFAPPEIKDISTERIVDSMKSSFKSTFLPSGNK